MAVAHSAQGFGAAICDALGLKRVLRLQLDLGPNHASVVATIAPDGYDELTNVIRRFDLHPKERPFESAPGDDVQANGSDAA